VEGEVFVQAFTPFHPAIQYARRHDYGGFYEQEMEFRQELKYPPAGRAALLLLKGRNEDKVVFSAGHLKQEIDKRAAAVGDLRVAGPAPAPLARAQGLHRQQIFLLTGHIVKLSRCLAEIGAALTLPDDVSLTVDIDPVNLM
jgi:primosomal protein N' (replication factor Y)